MRNLLITLTLALTFSASAQEPTLRVWSATPAPATEPPAAAPVEPSPVASSAELASSEAQPEKFASIVIDPAHIAQTLNNIQQAYQRYLQLVSMVQKAERNLETLTNLPFVDPENGTGAFLANMHWLLSGGNYDEHRPELVEETLGYSHPEIIDLLGEYFPGPRIVPGAEQDPRFPRPDPWESWERPADLYLARDNAMLSTVYRVAEILGNHAAQVGRERRGIAWQRDEIYGADGNVEHLEMLFAAMHQSLDAQTVERQVRLLGANLQYLSFADEVNERLEERALNWHHITSLRENLEIEPLTEAGGTSIGLHF